MPRCDLRPVPAIFALWVIAITSAISAQAEIRAFGNWIVGCDNKAECTAVGTVAGPSNPTAPAMVLRIGVDRTSPSGFEFAIIPLPDGYPTPRPMIITCLLCANGLHTAGEEMVDRFELHGQRLTIPDRKGARWLDALGQGRRMTVAWTGSAASAPFPQGRFCLPACRGSSAGAEMSGRGRSGALSAIRAAG